MNAGVRDLSFGEEEKEWRFQGPQSQPATSGQSQIIERDLKSVELPRCVLWSSSVPYSNVASVHQRTTWAQEGPEVQVAGPSHPHPA